VVDVRANPDTLSPSEFDTVHVGGSRPSVGVEPTPGTLGRYVVLEEVGRGGMGRVFRAYDPKLERIVALKCLRVDPIDERHAQAAARIVREARLMARLSHPNVVPVYDVDQEGDTLFVAMEFVAGATLHDWLEHKPSIAEVLRVLAEAGLGLAAAHDAGIVHRDFKPANVMVGADGRARVMDFGISRVSDEPRERDSSDGPLVSRSSSDDLLTEVGHVVGTPVAMSPEQQSGRGTDARGDQYSFCLVLFEAVYGARAFTRQGPSPLLERKLAGPPAQPVRRGVPRRIVQVIARGLSPDPNRRWPSMHVLVERMGSALQRRGVQVAALVGTVTMVAAAGFFAGRTATTGACDPDRARAAWDPDARAEIRQVISGEGTAASSDVAARTVDALDVYAEGLAEAVTRACVDDRRVPVALDVAGRCLDDAQAAMDATIKLLRRRGATLGPRALDAVFALPDPGACIDPDRVRLVAPIPQDAAAALEVRALRGALAEVKALEDIGDYATALAELQARRSAIDAAAYDPLRAEVLLREGALLERTGAYGGAVAVLRRAYALALGSGHDGAALAAATALAGILGAREADFAAAEPWIEHGGAWVSRVGAGGLEEARLLAVVAAIDGARGRYAEAQAGLERAIALQEAAGRGEHPDVAGLHDALGEVYLRRAELDAAADQHTRALSIREAVLGPDHPDVAASLDSLGIIAKAQGRAHDAVELHTRALAIRETTLGLAHPDAAATLVNLGTALEHAGELPAARARLERAAAIIERAFGREHPRLGAAEGNLGNVEYAMGRWPEALAHYQRAAAIFRVALGDDHPDVAMAHNNVGLVALQLGRHELARAELERARDIWERSLGPNHPHVAMALANLGEAAHADGRDGEAEVNLARARDVLLASSPIDDAELFAVCATLGAVHLARGDRERARTQLAQALAHGERAAVAEAELAAVRLDLARLPPP
jgi:tetratricopeptide (TPR) repeat protein/tRNA A-37 threonylcarbamoyl transferase component Bud32